VTILVITAFQVYWLIHYYDRENTNLLAKTNMSFHETVRRLQGAKLRLEKIIPDSLAKGEMVSVFVDSKTRQPMKVRFGPREEIVSTLDILKSKIRDSLRERQAFQKGMIIASNAKTIDLRFDSSGREAGGRPHPGKDYFFKMLYGVDSLQDSLKLREIKQAYEKELKEQNAEVPFTISRLDSCDEFEDPASNKVTIGFAHPVTYQLDVGNTFGYLMKRITAPILFSFFLIGVTILSFVLLYRSLLRQRKLAVLKNEFISNITHELKTPIATVGVAIEALKILML
jgi:two-component system phosphate regulon sensor histidine kinase PhoR